VRNGYEIKFRSVIFDRGGGRGIGDGQTIGFAGINCAAFNRGRNICTATSKERQRKI
jgi:hypothetical protein